MATDKREIIMSRDFFRANLVRHYNETMNEEHFELLNERTLQLKRKLIQKEYDQMKEYHRKLVCITKSRDQQFKLNEEMSEIDEKLLEMLTTIDEKCDKETNQEKNKGKTETSVIKLVQQRVPEVGTFNGEPSDWPAFRDLFVAEVHDKTDMEPVTKLIYLQKACRDNAKRTLGTWLLTDENYEAAWNLLKEKYEDNFSVKQSLLTNLRALPAIRRENFNELRMIVDTTNTCLRQLKVLGVATESWDDIIINFIMERLPTRTIDAFEQTRTNQDNPNLKRVLDFLDGRARGCKTYNRMLDKSEQYTHKTDSRDETRIEHRNDQRNEKRYENRDKDQRENKQHGQYESKFKDRRVNSRENRFKPYTPERMERKGTELVNRPERMYHSDQRGGRFNYIRNQSTPNSSQTLKKMEPLGPCRQCKTQTHRLWECEDFMGQELEERRVLARRWKLCFGCLSPYHQVKNCYRDVCQLCKDEVHSTALCPKQTTRNQSSTNGRISQQTTGSN